MTTIRITLFRTPEGSDGPLWCWTSDHSHGQAHSADTCLRAGYEAEARLLDDGAADHQKAADSLRAQAAAIRAMKPKPYAGDGPS